MSTSRKPPVRKAPDDAALAWELAELDVELATVSGELEQILGQVSAVQAAAGADVAPTSHPIAMSNVFREDVPAGMLTQEQAVDQAPDAQDGQFKVPAILDGE